MITLFSMLIETELPFVMNPCDSYSPVRKLVDIGRSVWNKVDLSDNESLYLHVSVNPNQAGVTHLHIFNL